MHSDHRDATLLFSRNFSLSLAVAASAATLLLCRLRHCWAGSLPLHLLACAFSHGFAEVQLLRICALLSHPPRVRAAGPSVESSRANTNLEPAGDTAPAQGDSAALALRVLILAL